MGNDGRIVTGALTLATNTPTDLTGALGGDIQFAGVTIQNLTGGDVLIGNATTQVYVIADGGEFELSGIDTGGADSHTFLNASEVYLSSAAGGTVNVLAVTTDVM